MEKFRKIIATSGPETVPWICIKGYTDGFIPRLYSSAANIFPLETTSKK
jgi:hypothetical protein